MFYERSIAPMREGTGETNSWYKRVFAVSVLAILGCCCLPMESEMKGENPAPAEVSLDKYQPTELHDRVPPEFKFVKCDTFECGRVSHRVAIYKHKPTRLDFVLLPGGFFTMGSPKEEVDRLENEGPQHEVKVEPFMICQTECTQKAWDRLDGIDERCWNKPRLPIHCMTFRAAEDWCRGAGLRLPTEAEWEYACRAGTKTAYYFGETADMLGAFAWYCENAGNNSHPVKKKMPNAFGLYDMYGNVWELCSDEWREDYDEPISAGAVDETKNRAWRGGGWYMNWQMCRSAARTYFYDDGKFFREDTGFRPVASLLEKSD